MNNTDITRLGKRVVQYFWDPLPRNQDPTQIWCLGRSYDSRYHAARQSKTPTTTNSSSLPSPNSDSDTSQADSAVSTVSPPTSIASASTGKDELTQGYQQVDLSRGGEEEESLGWPSDFLSHLESSIWLTYRHSFPLIAKSPDPAAASTLSLSTKLRNLGNQAGFTSDTGWGCMIRSGQSLLANSLAVLKLGRDWRLGQREQEHKELLALFADTPDAPFSIHRLVQHGADACGKHPGEWFGPSAAARCLQALTDRHPAAGLRVYARPDDGDVYVDSLLATTGQLDASDNGFQPTLIVLGLRLGIDRITPVYHAALRSTLELPQAVGIAGGRPASSHYFVGHQGDQFFYLDPHSTRAALPLEPSDEDVRSCHTRRVRRLSIAEMDPSMLIGFLVRDREDFEDWRRRIEGLEGKGIVHVHETEPRYTLGGTERPGAVDEVETWDETGEENEGEENEGEED